MWGFANGLVISGVYNVGNASTNLAGTKQIIVPLRWGVRWYSFRFQRMGISCTLTGRKRLEICSGKRNRSFFYPVADVSIILSTQFLVWKESEWDWCFKIHGVVTLQVGQVSIGPYRCKQPLTKTMAIHTPAVAGLVLATLWFLQIWSLRLLHRWRPGSTWTWRNILPVSGWRSIK